MLTVIGCGNPNRTDDGVGVRIAQRLAERLARHPVPFAQAFDCGTAGMDVLYRARGSDALVIVDACTSGGEPGAVYEVPGAECAEPRDATFSLHDFRWDHALYAGRRIYKEAFPEDVTVFLIEAESTALGLSLTDRVRASADIVFARLLDRIAEYGASKHADAAPLELEVCRGSIRLSAEVFERYFGGMDGVAAVPGDGVLFLARIADVAGGLIVKRRNAAGDRSIDAVDVLRREGWDDTGTYPCIARWDEGLGALALSRPAASAGEAPAHAFGVSQ